LQSLFLPGFNSKGVDSKRMPFSNSLDDQNLDDQSDDRSRWNRKYREAQSAGTKMVPDPFLTQAFSEYVLPLYPKGGKALDVAGGSGRHAIWLAERGWEVTLIDISETGVELARQSAGPLASHIHFVVDDLTGFAASQTGWEMGFDLVLGFFYLERKIFAELMKAIRPGGILIYKTYTSAQATRVEGPVSAPHLLEPEELLKLAAGLRVLHYDENKAGRTMARLVARKT
jgi:SAM-dependent methyltransferase